MTDNKIFRWIAAYLALEALLSIWSAVFRPEALVLPISQIGRLIRIGIAIYIYRNLGSKI